LSDLLYLFRWQDALEIIVLTFIFYRVYLRLRKKRAFRMIFAILALPFFYLIARWIDFPLSVWGLQNLWAVILLVLVVIFQQEIREVLGSISLPSFFLGRSEKISSEVSDRIADSAFEMAREGTGGLIVLQREDDLDEFIHGQTLIDAEVNEPLLLSLFLPRSPLHDGAVIIRGNRIRYAGALLPVSQSLGLPQEWGTRHRAGLGITEGSDAGCIVISEERKEVLLAYRGKIEKKEDKDELKRSLSGFPVLPEVRDQGRGWVTRLSYDLPAKGLFLVLVCLLWIFVIGIRQGEINLNIPVEYYSPPKDLEISGEPPSEINVRLKGSQRLLSSVKSDHLRVRVDLSGGHRGTNQIPLSETSIVIPAGIAVTHFYPQRVRIQLSPVSLPGKKP
jgi:uncharacterized protein (TIGR00159 family)